MGIWQQLRLDMQISLNLGSYTRKKTPVTAKLQNCVEFAVKTMNYITNCLTEP